MYGIRPRAVAAASQERAVQAPTPGTVSPGDPTPHPRDLRKHPRRQKLQLSRVGPGASGGDFVLVVSAQH